MRYRADIDGLRAVAVLPVVLFHAGFAAFGGGYIGVDVFFVISGYLITRIVAREVREERFSVLSFYERRIRRIFPALAVVVAFCWFASAFVLLPSAFKDFSQSAAAAALFVSNLLFWREAGYFSPAADSKPLLHTWSLSVEEQFYLLFPLLLVLLRARSKAFQKGALAALAIASFAVSVWLVDDSPTAAFYFSGGRAWELLLGSLLALDALPRPRSRGAAEAAAAAGLGLIAWSVFAYTSFTPFPGRSALAPCMGAALILLAGESVRSRTAALLSLAPIVWVGKILLLALPVALAAAGRRSAVEDRGLNPRRPTALVDGIVRCGGVELEVYRAAFSLLIECDQPQVRFCVCGRGDGDRLGDGDIRTGDARLAGSIFSGGAGVGGVPRSQPPALGLPGRRSVLTRYAKRRGRSIPLGRQPCSLRSPRPRASRSAPGSGHENLQSARLRTHCRHR